MKHASLFSGIGGFDLAAEWMGWENVFNCEWDSWCQKLLKQNFPNAEQHGDIIKTDFTKYKGTIDIVSGGFPCQPFSQAGKQEGTDDDRYLWPDMLRAIREIQPTDVVGENVGGLVSWSEGLVFEQVLSDLENEGYEVFPVILPACAVNAPHRRDRIWFVAYASGFGHRRGDLQGCKIKERKICKGKCQRGDLGGQDSGCDRERSSANPKGRNERSNNGKQEEGQIQESREGIIPNFEGFREWENIPQPGISRGDDGISKRMDRIKGLGNAIVPQIAKIIFEKVQELDSMK